jgi:predicted transcriptional regulator of viral defense system
MKYLKLKDIKRLYFDYAQIAKALGVGLSSARVSANRYVTQGFLIRIRRNLYILRERWDSLTIEELFEIANLIQVPSYISLMTALGYYEVTTQIQRDYIESLAVKRTKGLNVEGRSFNFTRIDKRLYFGFSREKGFFIASPEKAFLDAFYLMSFNKYKFDLSSIDFNKLDMTKTKKMARCFPKRTQEALKNYGYFKKT